jgi:hypothetical protein
LVILEIVNVERRAWQHNNASILKYLGEVTFEVPFFNVPSTNAPQETLNDVVNLTCNGTNFGSSHFFKFKR